MGIGLYTLQGVEIFFKGRYNIGYYQITGKLAQYYVKTYFNHPGKWFVLSSWENRNRYVKFTERQCCQNVGSNPDLAGRGACVLEQDT